MLFRWGALAWTAWLVSFHGAEVVHPALVFVLLGVAVAFTVWATVILSAHPARLLGVRAVVVEVALGVALSVAHGWVFGGDVAFRVTSFGSAWALGGVLAAGLAFGPRWGGIAGGVVALSRWAAVLAPDAPRGPFTFKVAPPDPTVPLVSSVVLFALAGALAGYVARSQRRAEAEVATVRAREEMARRLHDTVLQTLAVFQRRCNDEALVTLARETDRELRDYLFRLPTGSSADLASGVRAAAEAAGRKFGFDAVVVTGADLDGLAAATVEATVGAVSEALANAAKHAAATRIQVLAARDDDTGEVLVAVRDDGRGFDPDAVGAGVGLRRSIVERVREVGGRVEVRSSPGAGTEVCVWVR